MSRLYYHGKTTLQKQPTDFTSSKEGLRQLRSFETSLKNLKTSSCFGVLTAYRIFLKNNRAKMNKATR